MLRSGGMNEMNPCPRSTPSSNAHMVKGPISNPQPPVPLPFHSQPASQPGGFLLNPLPATTKWQGAMVVKGAPDGPTWTFVPCLQHKNPLSSPPFKLSTWDTTPLLPFHLICARWEAWGLKGQSYQFKNDMCLIIWQNWEAAGKKCFSTSTSGDTCFVIVCPSISHSVPNPMQQV